MDGRRFTLVLRRMLLIFSLAALLACQTVASLVPDRSTPTGSPDGTDTPAPLDLPPYPAPKLLSHKPEVNEALALDAPIELVFDQPMDQASVRDAFKITPEVPGELVWADSRTARFLPSASLARGAHYEVRVGDEARNIEGEALLESIAFDVQTIGFLEVTEVYPQPGSRDVEPNTAVTVIFNRPVVPLAALDAQADLPDLLSFVPPVRGVGEWLTTSIYRFHPEDGFAPATHYTGRLASGLEDTTGAVMEDGYTWTFTTLTPKALAWSPEDNANHVAPSDVISITFNQPMDHASTEAAVQVGIQNRTLEGVFRWEGGRQPTDPETLLFVPDQPLPRNAAVQVTVNRSARARSSQVTLSEAFSWLFFTVRDPGILSTTPRDGDDDVEVFSDVEIVFASPMQRNALLDHMTIIPEPTEVYSYWYASDTELRLSFAAEPATTYQVTLDAAYLDRHGEALGEFLSLQYTTGDLSPYASLSTLGAIGTFNAYTDTVLYARHRNISRLDLALYALPLETFMRLHGYGSYTYRRDFRPSAADLVRAWSIRIDAPRNTTALRRIELVDSASQQLPPGIYYVELTAPEVIARYPDEAPDHTTFVRSGINLLLKQSKTASLIWATDLDTGAPIHDLPMRFFTEAPSTTDAPIAYGAGRTDRDGLLKATAPAMQDLWSDVFAFSGDPGDPDFAIAFNQWDSGISPWNFDLPSDYGDTPYVGYLYTDRPIYRPGQTVYFKGILRQDDDVDYAIPADIAALQLVVDDPQGRELYRETLPVSEMGTFFDELALGSEAALGTYFIRVQSERWDVYISTNFRVAEYRAPEFEVTVETDREAYLNGETLNVTVDANYYFGGPVANADLQWNLLSGPYTFNYVCPAGQSCPRYSWSDDEWTDDYGESYGRYGRLVADGTTATNAQGRATFRLPAELADEVSSRRFTIEANITDINDQVVSQRSTAIVHKGEIYLGLAPERRVAQAGRAQEINLLTVDWDSVAVGDVEAEIVVMERRWYSVRQASENGYNYWTWTVEDIPVYTTTATTDAQGMSSIIFTPESSGSYRVRATAEDARGNQIQSSTYLWVWGGGEAVWRRESTNRIDLIADRDTYEVGDVAEILVPSPYSGTVHALITIERGQVLDTEVRELSGSTELLRIPIKETHVPNIYVSVVLVQGAARASRAGDGGQTEAAVVGGGSLASFRMGQIMLPVSTASKQLRISLTPDREINDGVFYRPRETAIYDVLVTDSEGTPVEAELSMRLADLSVLALSDETAPTLLERFWSHRGLGVRTSTALVVAMEPYNRELVPEAKGGGGGEMVDEGLIRSRFADTAFWDPVVRTGADGRAQVTVQLPDNLTTWRMQARGLTSTTLVGRAEADIRSTLDLLVRPALPRFFVINDEAEIATIVHNNTAEDLSTVIALAIEGLDVEGQMEQMREIPAGEQVRVAWPVKVLPGEQATVRMEARAGAHFDGREDTLPVYHYTTPEVVATAGRLSEPDLRQEVIQLPHAFDPTQGELTVQVDGSLTAATRDALTYLTTYPYECVEQTVSRFLPNVLTYQALVEMGLPHEQLAVRVQDEVSLALQKLYNEQHYDGGWGWWLSDDSNPYLTAYVIQGLLEAYRAGFAVDESVVENAVAYLRENLASISRQMSAWQANRLAYQLYILGEYLNMMGADSEGELNRAVRLFEQRERLDRYGQAMLATALGLLEPEEDSRVATLLSDLAGDIVISATGAHWEEEEPDTWNMNTDTRSTAIILWAMARHRPESDLLPNVVRWLMTVRREGYWESTNTTAWSLMGLVAYMRATGELRGDYGYTVSLNGELLLSGEISTDTITESQGVQVAIAELLVDRGNRLIIERERASGDQSGEGQLYYTAHLRYFRPVEEVKALDRGIIVERQYSPIDDPAASINEARVGDTIRVKLTVIAPTDLHYVTVEDPLPAGCEAVDVTLNTTSVVGEAPSIRNLTAEEEDSWYRWYGWGWWWFSHSEIRDEKVVLFSSYLPRGTYEYSYVMRASIPGSFHVIPATAYQMYFPEVFGRSAGGKFSITAE